MPLLHLYIDILGWIESYFCYKNAITFYITQYNTLIPSVCLIGYRFSPWTSYRLETSIIRTSMTWGCVTWKNFFRKVSSGQITEEKYFAINAFLWEKFLKMQILRLSWLNSYRMYHFHRRDHFYGNDKFSRSISKQILV